MGVFLWGDGIWNCGIISNMKSKKIIIVLVAIIILSIVSLACSLWLNIGFREDKGSPMTDESSMPISANSDSIISKLGLMYKVYDGSEDVQIKSLFNNPKLSSIQSGSITLGENALEVGNGNINVGGESFSVDKKGDVYIKLITDSEVAAFIFKDEQLKKFQNFDGTNYDTFKTQDTKNFVPLKALEDSYSVISLEPGLYTIVVVPTKKAVTILTEIKTK